MTEAQEHTEAHPAGGRKAAAGTSPRAERLRSMIAEGRCVLLDGAVGTELPKLAHGGCNGGDERLWGTRALIDTPAAVADVHRRYVGAGCDVISTNTWGLASALSRRAARACGTRPARPCTGWTSPGAACGSRSAPSRRPAARDECAVAFSLNADLDSPDGRETIRLLARLFDDEPAPPDLVLVETLSVLRPSLFDTVEELLGIGLPVWLSFRRCRHGVCGVYGEHWGGPEGDDFGRAARRFERMGVGALLVNCIPPDHVGGMVSYLRDFSDLPLGVYPNLGYFTDAGWRFTPGVDGGEYARMALRVARGGRADRRRLLRHAPRAHRRRRAGRSRAPKPGRRRRGGLEDGRRAARGAGSRRGPTAASAACTRCRSPTSPSTPASSRPTRRASWSGAPLPTRASAPTSAAWTSARARASSPSSSRSTAPRTCARSTSTRARWRTR